MEVSEQLQVTQCIVTWVGPRARIGALGWNNLYYWIRNGNLAA